MTIQAVLADTMTLTPEERAQLARWLDVCVRNASERDLRNMLGGFGS